MVDFTNLFKSIQGISLIRQGADITQSGYDLQAQTIIQGGEISAQGAELSAEGFRVSAESIRQASIFNQQVQSINDFRRLQTASRSLQRTLGSNLAAQAASGLSLTGPSFLQVQNEVRSSFEKNMLNMKIDSENRKRAAIFETQIKMTNLENQARASEYRASAERTLAANRAAEASFQGEVAQYQASKQISQGIPTLLSQVFSNV